MLCLLIIFYYVSFKSVILGLVCADVAHGQRRGRRPGRRQQFRRGRQDAVPPADGYAGAEAPVDSYGAGAADEAIPTYADEGALDTYADASDAQDTYAAADPAADAAAAELAALESNIPGIPGEDYPIFAEVPETAFLCDGQVDGGKLMTILSISLIKEFNTNNRMCCNKIL